MSEENKVDQSDAAAVTVERCVGRRHELLDTLLKCHEPVEASTDDLFEMAAKDPEGFKLKFERRVKGLRGFSARLLRRNRKAV